MIRERCRARGKERAGKVTYVSRRHLSKQAYIYTKARSEQAFYREIVQTDVEDDRRP
jgi:hypothetical protein